MDYTKKYQKIVNYLIKKSFPELNNRRVRIVEFPNIISVAESTSIKIFTNYYIFINKKCKTRNTKALTGQFAHELCHIVLDYLHKGLFTSLLHFVRKTMSAMFNTPFSRKIETQTDKETIKRGYARELYSLNLDKKKRYSERILKKSLYTRGYLTPKQIMSYAQKIRKWNKTR